MSRLRPPVPFASPASPSLSIGLRLLLVTVHLCVLLGHVLQVSFATCLLSLKFAYGLEPLVPQSLISEGNPCCE